jgi:hypothetical protein
MTRIWVIGGVTEMGRVVPLPRAVERWGASVVDNVVGEEAVAERRYNGCLYTVRGFVDTS